MQKFPNCLWSLTIYDLFVCMDLIFKNSASINLAQSAGNIALDAGLGTRRAAQIAKIVKLVPLLKDLVELGSDSTSNQRPLEVLGSLGLDLDSGLAFLRQNNLGIADGLRLLSTIANNDGGASLKSLSDINHSRIETVVTV